MAMLPKKKLEWREGQNLFEFVVWLKGKWNLYTVDVVYKLEELSDADFERLYNEFLAEGNEAKC